MSKEEVSSSYLDQQKALHAWKEPKQLRTVVVIGAGPGKNIGQGIVDQIFLSNQHEVVAPDIAGFDVKEPRAVMENYFNHIDADVLVLANGFTALDWIEDVAEQDMEKMINVNLLGSMRASQAFVRSTIKSGHRKTIIFIGSMAHRSVLNGSASYCAAKAGLAHYAKCLGWELSPKGYDIFIVHPSNVEGTPMTEATIQGLMDYRNLNRAAAEKYWGAINLQDRWLNPDDIAEVVSFLINNPSARFLSGTNIELTGGQR